MQTPVIQSFPYRRDSSELFAGLLERAWPVFLDSGHPFSGQGRYDILTADPSTTLRTHGSATEIQRAGRGRTTLADPFMLLGEALGPARPGIDALPFRGGAIGYFAYDLARRLERLPSRALACEDIPDMAVGIYDWGLVVDHRQACSHLFAPDRATLRRYADLLSTAGAGIGVTGSSPDYRVLDPVRASMSRDQYLEAVERIKQYLRDGDCYQVNLARRFAVRAEGEPWQAYQRLRRLNAAPFGAYLGWPDAQVLCSSPERFLMVREGRVETRPIKGTCPRGRAPGEDWLLAEKLRLSPKDRAENLMIVDLLRNDLGKVCEFGSIQVPSLFAVETYARVHHLVSRVSGRLAPGRSSLDLMRACFPGGSITGAPKLRAMEIIEELEIYRRGLYCGAIGYLGFDGAMDTNIVIRTLVHSKGVTRLWAGGGIVADSDPAAEYRETEHKAEPLLETLEQMRR